LFLKAWLHRWNVRILLVCLSSHTRSVLK
jgi:hypothetical protein